MAHHAWGLEFAISEKETTRLKRSCGRAKERQKAFIIAELRQKYPLKDLLELSGIARSTYYYYLKQKDKDKYKSEKQDILEIYNTHKGSTVTDAFALN